MSTPSRSETEHGETDIVFVDMYIAGFGTDTHYCGTCKARLDLASDLAGAPTLDGAIAYLSLYNVDPSRQGNHIPEEYVPWRSQAPVTSEGIKESRSKQV